MPCVVHIRHAACVVIWWRLEVTMELGWLFLKGDAAMVQLVSQIMVVWLLIGVVGAIWMIASDHY